MPKFLVAFSLAGEQRELVRAIATEVRHELGEGRVFLDEWFEHLIAGHDADVRLQKIYGEDCELAVLCVSEHYGNKPWTKAEHEAIRARYMQIRASSDEREQFRVLPIRVGDGDVRGILLNTIVPDVRDRTPRQAAELIIRRLREIVPADAGAKEDWPATSPALRWPMADHAPVREAFASLLTRDSRSRCLLLRGPSEAGKSHITRQMLANVVHIQGLDCGRFDFKGTTDMDEALGTFVQYLDIPLPPASPRFHERLGRILAALRQRPSPALLIFDTYEAASSEAQEWIDKELLPALIRAKWLRVVIAGQRVPERANAIWETEAAPVIELKPPPPEDWFQYGKQYKPGLTPEFVQELYKHSLNKASVLAQVLGPG